MKRALFLAVLFLAACRNEKPAETATGTASALTPSAVATARDPHSYARPQEVRVEHIGLDLTVDFAKKQLSGTANLRIKKEQGATTLMLDTNGLDIRRVTLQPGGAPAQFKLGAA